MIKDATIFDKYIKIREKVSNTIKRKKIYTELFNKKERFQCFYIPVMLFDSVYRKDGNYYPKVFLEKFVDNFFFEKYLRNFGFSGFGSASWNIRNVFGISNFFSFEEM